MPIGESLKLTKQEPILSDSVRHAIFSFEVAMKVDIADSSDIGGAVSGRVVWQRLRRCGKHHFAHQPVAEIPRSGAQTPAVIGALRIDAFNPDRALVALPAEPIPGVWTGLPDGDDIATARRVLSTPARVAACGFHLSYTDFTPANSYW